MLRSETHVGARIDRRDIKEKEPWNNKCRQSDVGKKNIKTAGTGVGAHTFARIDRRAGEYGNGGESLQRFYCKIACVMISKWSRMLLV